MTATQSPTDKTFAAALKAASILEAQFKKHPDHPGVAHYLIHATTIRRSPSKGLTAAKRYAEHRALGAARAAHALAHLHPRRRVAGVGRDQRRSTDVAKAEERGRRLHAMDYMVYAYLQLARDTDAQRAVEEAHGSDAAPHTLRATRMRLLRFRRATQSSAARGRRRRAPAAGDALPFAAALTHFARAVGAARSGDPAVAERDVQELARSSMR